MNSTHIHHFLRHLIFRALGYMANVVKGEVNGVWVGFARSYAQC